MCVDMSCNVHFELSQVFCSSASMLKTPSVCLQVFSKHKKAAMSFCSQQGGWVGGWVPGWVGGRGISKARAPVSHGVLPMVDTAGTFVAS